MDDPSSTPHSLQEKRGENLSPHPTCVNVIASLRGRETIAGPTRSSTPLERRRFEAAGTLRAHPPLGPISAKTSWVSAGDPQEAHSRRVAPGLMRTRLSDSGGVLGQAGIVVDFELDRWFAAEAMHQPGPVEPVDPIRGEEFDVGQSV